MENNYEEDNESSIKNKARAPALEGFHIFYSSILYLIGMQGLLHMILFIFKRMLLSYLTIEQFGVQVVQFHTFTTFIFYISREGFRCGCLRQGNCDVGQDVDSKWVQNNSRVLAVAWLTMPWGMFLALGTLSFVMWWQDLHVFSDYNSSIFILGVATILELCCEPLYIWAQHLLMFRLRVLIEVAATISQCVVTYIIVHPRIGVDVGQAFVYAQVAYSCCLFLCYWSYFLFIYQGMSIFPFKLVYSKDNLFCFGFKRNLKLDVSLLQLCITFTFKSGLLKFIQQEGDKFLLVIYETTHIQGIYGLVDNIGSLVVRFIFQPFEESAFTMFARDNYNCASIATNKKNSNNWSKERMFFILLKLAILIGLVFVALISNYGDVLLRLYNKDWSDGNATIALGYYCLYILILAINGISEAFVRAVITKQELLNGESISKLVFFPIASMCLNITLLHVASSNGLILSKCIIMSMQIYYNLYFIQQYFKHSQTFSLWHTLPNWRVLGMIVTYALAPYLSKSFVLDYENLFFSIPTLHIGVDIACLCGLSATMFKYERVFLQEILAFRNKKRD